MRPLSVAKNVAIIGLCAGMMIALQVAMSSLPNIHPVALLVILFTQTFGKRTFMMIYVFVLVEGMIYGFHEWWFAYLYVWSILALIVLLLGEVNSPMVWALVSAIFGLLFGVLCSPVFFITRGFIGGLSWVAAGFIFDVIHCVANFLIALLLWKPLSRALQYAKTNFAL